MDKEPIIMTHALPNKEVINNQLNIEVNLKKDAEFISEEYESDSNTNSNADNEEYYDSVSENSFECEPDVNRSFPILHNLETKKKMCINSSNYIYGKYVLRQCPMCDSEFNSAHCWKKHINYIHHLATPEDLQFKYNEVGAKCKICDFQTATPDFNKLLDHQISHMPFSLFLKCKLCDWRTKTHPSMNFHLRQVHSDKLDMTKKSIELTVCPYCQQEFSSQWYLRKHMFQEHEKTIDDRTCFICLDCGEEFPTNVSLRAHVFEKFADKSVEELSFKEVISVGEDNDISYKCTQCPTIYRKSTSSRTLTNLREHYMLHLGELTGKHAYKCKYCDESFRRFDYMRLHICEELRKALQSCANSHTILSAKGRRNKLSKKNVQQEPVELKRDYMKHIRHVCLKCGNSYGKLFHCKRHMYIKHGMSKPSGLDFKKIANQSASEVYECTICEEFTCDLDLNTMLVHARIHTVYDPLLCKICNTSFAYETDIPGHDCVDVEVVETVKESRYPREIPIPNMDTFCPKCDLTYTTPSSLTRHMNRMHGMHEPYGLGFVVCETNGSTEVVFRCTQCENFTINVKNLKAMLEHARLHLPYESFRCVFCKERFHFKEQARQHQCSKNTTEAVNIVDKYDQKILKTRLNKMGRLCPKCGKKFAKPTVCKVHTTNIHGLDKPAGLGFEKLSADNVDSNREKYRCNECLSFVVEKLDLSLMSEHAREHFPYDSFWCMLCDEQFKFKLLAIKHKCPNDTRTVEENNDGDFESTAHTKYPKTFEKIIKKFCPECNFEVPTMKAWRWHISKYHEMTTLTGLQMKQAKGNLVECLICQVKTTYVRRLDHRFVHLPFKPYQCRYCLEYFIEVEKAKAHCGDCAVAPTEFDETEETKKAQANKRTASKGMEAKIDNKRAKIQNKRETVSHVKANGANSSSERLDSESENDNADANRCVSVVLTDDNDFAKFIRISCPLCPDTEFESNLMLTRHFNEAHNNFREHFTIHQTNAANCKTCKKYFNVVYKKTMIKHYLSEINATCFCCRLCDKNILYFETMRSHLLDDHQAVIAGQQTHENSNTTAEAGEEVDPLKVTAVDISKVSRTTMAIPSVKTAVFNEFNEYISYACPECNEHFDTSEQWHLHINGAHSFFEQHQLNIEATSDGFKRCKQCSVNISGGILAEQRHKLTHMQYKSFICILCQHRSTTLGVLTQHFRRRHFAKGTFKCVLCPSVLSTSCEQIEHMKNEHDPSEYPSKLCRVCFSMFSSINSLNTHMDLHNPNRKVFQCDYCDRYYKYKRELGLHVRAKHPEQEAKASEGVNI
ncbi:zinc finger protein 62-like isoform X3 [Bactrocera tryoni]|uniref:zinc finger protein 62-like isoform X3 n=1 Tax=Bactrocera tryoni TaxID=59916 RepID=UPI001A95F391|nr:zinc finger protein 62-like isoform X3 [Bactrocera tryoni]